MTFNTITKAWSEFRAWRKKELDTIANSEEYMSLENKIKELYKQTAPHKEKIKLWIFSFTYESIIGPIERMEIYHRIEQLRGLQRALFLKVPNETWEDFLSFGSLRHQENKPKA